MMHMGKTFAMFSERCFLLPLYAQKFLFLQKLPPSFLSQYLTVFLKILCPTTSCVLHESHGKNHFSGIELVFFPLTTHG